MKHVLAILTVLLLILPSAYALEIEDYSIIFDTMDFLNLSKIKKTKFDLSQKQQV